MNANPLAEEFHRICVNAQADGANRWLWWEHIDREIDPDRPHICWKCGYRRHPLFERERQFVSQYSPDRVPHFRIMCLYHGTPEEPTAVDCDTAEEVTLKPALSPWQYEVRNICHESWYWLRVWGRLFWGIACSLAYVLVRPRSLWRSIKRWRQA